MSDGASHTVMAEINDKIVRIDLASENRSSYKNEKDIKYLGFGHYYSIDGRLQSGFTPHHFWAKKSTLKEQKDALLEKKKEVKAMKKITKKLSKKQKEVVDLLKENGGYITFMKGMNARCFIPADMLFKISTTTFFGLLELGVISEIKGDWRASDYGLSELGKMAEI